MPKLSHDLIVHYMCFTLEIDYGRHIKDSFCVLGDGITSENQCRNKSNSKDFSVLHELQVIWAIWQDKNFSTTATHGRLAVTLGLLATRLLCSSCSKSYLKYFPLVDKWMGVLRTRPCPDNLKDPNHTVFLPWVPAKSATSNLNGALPALTMSEGATRDNERMIQDLRRRVEESHDHAFLAKLFGLVEELKWMEANQAPWDTSSESTAVAR